MADFEAETRQLSDALLVIRKGLNALPKSPELLVGQMEYQFRACDAAGAADTPKSCVSWWAWRPI